MTIRFLRVLWLFGIILASYLVQFGFVRLFRRRGQRMPRWLKARRERVDVKNARRLLRGMLRLRGVFIKLGQVLSILGGFLPRAFTKELESLQDNVPPHPFRHVERTFVAAYGKKPDQCFASFEREPIAAASLGQVHVAFLVDGQKVAVKVLYPRIRDVIRVDMRALKIAILVLRRWLPQRNLETVHRSLVDLLQRETDYEHEAACMERMAKNFAGEPDILFPSVVHDWTTKDILTMSFMEGVKITRLDELDRLGIDRTKLATRLVQSFYKQLFVDRYFHADPHPGNFLVQKGPAGEPRIVVLDFGAISEVTDELVDGALEVLQGIMSADGAMALKGFRGMGFVAEGANEELLEQTVMTYFRKLLKIKDHSAGALIRADRRELEKLANPDMERAELRELMRSIAYPEGWFYVERASVIAFWLVGQIDPELDTMSIGVPYVLPLVMSRQMKAMAG
ncbi:MAG TPA: AarF/UbiB family protein [Polyangiaceae bacterium]|jgi:predicted unusual protein kinase regulating ubiquinone biosynthesis (AarF/ABC1/UbiB family)